MAVIKDEEWIEDRLRPNWEFVRLEDLPLTDSRRYRFELTDDLQIPQSEQDRLRPRELLSRAAVALALGLQAYRSMRSQST